MNKCCVIAPNARAAPGGDPLPPGARLVAGGCCAALARGEVGLLTSALRSCLWRWADTRGGASRGQRGALPRVATPEPPPAPGHPPGSRAPRQAACSASKLGVGVFARPGAPWQKKG